MTEPPKTPKTSATKPSSKLVSDPSLGPLTTQRVHPRLQRVRDALNDKPDLLWQLIADLTRNPPKIAGPWEPGFLDPASNPKAGEFRIVRKNYVGEVLAEITRKGGFWHATTPRVGFKNPGAEPDTTANLDKLKGIIDDQLRQQGLHTVDGIFVDWQPWHQPQPPRDMGNGAVLVYRRHSALTDCIAYIVSHTDHRGGLIYEWSVLGEEEELLAWGQSDTLLLDARVACDRDIVKAGLGAGLARIEAWAPRVQVMADLSQIEMRP